MTEAERQARVRLCERCGRTWLAFGRRGERCVWCLPSIPGHDELRLSVDVEEEGQDDAA